MENIYTPSKNYKVLVHTITYNQAKYIAETLDGVAMQQTNFPFVHYVIDDCSTDGEQSVIDGWLNKNCEMNNAKLFELELADVIIVSHKTNCNLTLAVYFLKRNLWKEPQLKNALVSPWRDHCEYESWCEGDDFWISNKKIQNQVEFLEQHADASMVFGAVLDLCPDGSTQEIHRYNNHMEKCHIEDCIKIGGGFAKLNSMMFDIEKYGEGYDKWITSPPIGDLPMQLTLFTAGNVYYIDKLWSCYRRGTEGSWTEKMSADLSFQNTYTKNAIRMWKAFDEYTNNRYSSLIKSKIRFLYKLWFEMKINWIVYYLKKIYMYEK